MVSDNSSLIQLTNIDVSMNADQCFESSGMDLQLLYKVLTSQNIMNDQSKALFVYEIAVLQGVLRYMADALLVRDDNGNVLPESLKARKNFINNVIHHANESLGARSMALNDACNAIKDELYSRIVDSDEEQKGIQAYLATHSEDFKSPKKIIMEVYIVKNTKEDLESLETTIENIKSGNINENSIKVKPTMDSVITYQAGVNKIDQAKLYLARNTPQNQFSKIIIIEPVQNDKIAIAVRVREIISLAPVDPKDKHRIAQDLLVNKRFNEVMIRAQAAGYIVNPFEAVANANKNLNKA